MKKIILVLFTASVITTFNSCRKKEAVRPEDPVIAVPHDNQGVKISFPGSGTVNYTDYALFSLADDAKVDAGGNATVSYNKGKTNIAWLFDKDDNLVMAGFVNDTAKTINAVSTAKVLLYYALSIPMLPEKLGDEFVKDIDKIKGAVEWENHFATLMANDRLVLSKGGYLTALKSAVQAMAKPATGNTSEKTATKSSGNQGRVSVRNADIDISFGDVKSGLQVFSHDLSKVNINNSKRRRAHAFFYKMKLKDLSGAETGLISKITETTGADKNESLSPTAAINSFTGVLGSWIEGKDKEFAGMEAGPYNFPLQDNESEATYKVRILGPGRHAPDIKLTTAEENKLFSLEVETFTVDFLIPIGATLLASKMDAKPSDNATQEQKDMFNATMTATKSIVEELIKGSPGVYDEIKKGKYEAALTKLLESVYAGQVNGAKEGFMKLMAMLARMTVEQKLYVSPHYDELKAQKRMMKILEVTDELLLLTDQLHIFHDILSSKNIEEWDMVLRGGKVTLQFVNGFNEVINTAQETKIKAEIKNVNETGGDQHPYYEWSTTGKFGKLVDTKGNSGSSFSTADQIITYQSTTNSSILSNGDNIDQIYVKALKNNVLIGMDTIEVNVKKIGYEMQPTDAVVTGKKHANAPNDVTLHLSKVVTGVRDIPGHATLDFKIEWSTSGAYGQLVGNTTTFNNDQMVYKATSEQIGKHNETITARVYARNKGETDYFFFEQVKGTVEIDNEQKKKILRLPIICNHGDTTYNDGKSMTCMVTDFVTFKGDPDAKSYNVAFYNVRNPSGASWEAGKAAPKQVPHYVFKAPEGSYAVQYGSSWKVGAPSQILKHMDCSNSNGLSGGMALITIYLK